MKSWKRAAAAGVLLFASLGGIASSDASDFKIGSIIIEQPWARQSMAASDAMAGFLVIKNGGAADRLVSATAEITPKVALHDMKMVGDVMKMVALKDGIEVPAGATVELKPKSLHVMFEELKSKPKQGDVFKGTLTFEKAGTVAVEYEVKAPNAGMN